MRLRVITENSDFALVGQIPPEPGTTPTPSNHIRLYHYTTTGSSDLDKFKAAQSLRHNGINISQAKGQSYGEPNVVWASTAMPGKFKVFAEFSVATDDPRWGIGKPTPEQSPAEYEARRGDCYFQNSIQPQEIIAVHEPWHAKYRYILDNPELQQSVMDNEFDRLLNTDEYGPAIRRVKASKILPHHVLRI